MKMKMKVIPLSVQRRNPNDINVINEVRRINRPNATKSKIAKVKKDEGIIASWFKPSKYKGFKAKIN